MGVFSKGIKLPKRLSSPVLRLLDLPLPDRVILPLKSYTTNPPTPVVSVGESVKKGQLIAEGTDSLPVHATISGKVVEITERLDARGTRAESVIIESDGNDDSISPPKEKPVGAEQILKAICDAGLIVKSMMPAPLDKDLVPLDQPKTHLYIDGKSVVKKTDTLIVNALDIEPSLGTNRYLAGTQNKYLSPGIDALKTVTGAQRTVFVTDTPSPQLEQIAKEDEQEMTSLVSVSSRHFPIALPAVLLKTVLKKEIPLPYGHPRDIGAAIYDMETVISAGEAVEKNTPQTHTFITIGGGAISQHGIAQVRIGTPAGHIIEALGGLKDSASKIIFGGPMTGIAHYGLDTPVTKDITGLFALTGDQIELTDNYTECINCGMCVKVCPVNLVPGMLSMYCAKGSLEHAETEGILYCIECGCCDYVCPSRRPLLHMFRHAKQQLTE